MENVKHAIQAMVYFLVHKEEIQIFRIDICSDTIPFPNNGFKSFSKDYYSFSDFLLVLMSTS